MPKKQQQNEFYYFMLDKKHDVERREGRTVSMSELPGLIYQEWKMLPESKKEKYKKMKDQHRENFEKMDCRGVPLRLIQAAEQERKQREKEMRMEITLTIETLKHGNALKRGKFFLVCTNVYVVTEEMKYIPAEIAILQFGLQNGIMDEHHIIIPYDIPMGYTYEAQVHSDKTHNLMNENNVADTDKDVGWSIMDFIMKSGKIEEGQKLPPLYTLEEQMTQTIEIFRTLLPEDELRIYSLDELFQNMYSAVFSDVAIPKSISHDMLTHCGLDFHPTIACEWHIQYQSDAGKYCALGCVRRWFFHICDNLKLEETFGIVAEEGKHLPRAQTNTGTVVDIPRPNLQSEYTSRSSPRDVSRASSTQNVFCSPRDVSRASSTQDVFSFTQSKKSEYTSRSSPRDVSPASSTQDVFSFTQSKKSEYTSRSSPRDVSRSSSTQDVFSFTQSKKAIAEINPAPAPTVINPAPAPAVSAWGRSAASNASKKTSSYGTAAGALTNAKPDTGCDDEFPALGARSTRDFSSVEHGSSLSIASSVSSSSVFSGLGRGKNLRGKF